MNRAPFAPATFHCVSLLVVCLAFAPAAVAAESAPPSGWTALGPYAANVRCLAADPKNPLIIYLGIDRGDIFRSANGGVSWKRVRTGNPVWTDTVWDLAVTPGSPSQVWAATEQNGLLRSTDGGNTWSEVGAGLPKTAPVEALLADAESPNTLFAGTHKGIYRSMNGGDDFVSVNRSKTLSIARLAWGPKKPRTIYLATGNAHGMAKSIDGGETWQPANRGFVRPKINALVVDPNEPSRLWAATDGGLYLSSDAAENWSFATALGNRNVNALFIDPEAPRTLLAIIAEGTFRSEDGGQGWSVWSRGAPPPTVRALTPGPAGSILAATSGLGVFRSTDGGRSWAPSSRGLAASDIYTVAVDPLQSRTLFAGGGVTAWRSSDGGGSWVDIGEGLSVRKGYAQPRVKAFAFDTRKQGIVYAADHEGVFRSTDGGLSWKTCQMPGAAFALAVDPARPDTVWAGSIDAVFASDDSCATWRKLPASFGRKAVSRILFGRGAAGLTFVATAGGLYRTDDGGKSFQGPAEGTGGHIRVTSLAADPVDAATVWAGTVKGLFVSRDGGTSWTATGPLGVAILDVVVHPKSSSRVFAGTEAGVIVTSDGGASWTALNESLPGADLQGLRLDPEGKTLYAATLGGGVLALQLRD
jgi:photosystem II stability/assembly factor-like uncharacterized protein